MASRSSRRGGQKVPDGRLYLSAAKDGHAWHFQGRQSSRIGFGGRPRRAESQLSIFDAGYGIERPNAPISRYLDALEVSTLAMHGRDQFYCHQHAMDALSHRHIVGRAHRVAVVTLGSLKPAARPGKRCRRLLCGTRADLGVISTRVYRGSSVVSSGPVGLRKLA